MVAREEPTAPPAFDIVTVTETASRALKTGAALLDRSDRGKLALSGEDAAECLNGQVTNDVAKIEPGCGMYATFLSTKGQMLGDVRIIRTADTFELDTERISLQALFDMLRAGVLGYDAELHKRTLQRGLFSLIGPKARAVAQVEDLSNCEFKNAPFTVEGIPAHAILTVSGVDVLCAAEDADAIRAALLARGAEAVTEEQAEVARIVKGRPRFGVELDGRTMPQEAGLNDRAVSFTKGCYVGQETVARLYYRGSPNRQLRGLRFADVPAGDPDVRLGEKVVGRISRVAVSPHHGIVAMALLRNEAEPGATVSVGGTEATVVTTPFARDERAVTDCAPSH